MRHPARSLAGCLVLLYAAGCPALAQEPAPEAAAPASAPEESPKPRPKRRPPAPRPAKPAAAKPADPAAEGAPISAPAAEEGAASASSDQGEGQARPAAKPAPRPRAPKPAAAKPQASPPAPAPAAETPPPASPTPAALSPPPMVAAEPPSACGARAALYLGDKGFSGAVTRLGRVEVENPLRPLTPEVTQVLQLTIGGKVATAYGPDLGALRRGGAPAVLESQLGGGIRWEPALPLLPETLSIVSEAGERLAALSFRACTEPPLVTAPVEARAKDRKPGTRRGAAKGEAAPKAPPGFHLPQGAISQ